jgi:hypothetical protein
MLAEAELHLATQHYALNGLATLDAFSVGGLGDSKGRFHIQPSMIRSRDDNDRVTRSTCKGRSQVESLAKQTGDIFAIALQMALRFFVSPLLFVLHRLGTCMLHHGNDLPGNGCLASFAFSIRLSLTPFDLHACACRSCLCPALLA